MQQQKSKGSIVFAVVAVVAVASTIASAGLGRRAKGQFAEARASMLAGCADCDGRAHSSGALPEYKLGSVELEAARVASMSGDRPIAAAALVRVLERADRIDRGHQLVSSVVTAKLIDGVAERIDADPALLDDARLASAIRRTSFASSRRPLEGERMHALGVLANVPAQVPIRTAGFAEAATTQAMEDVNVTLHQMESSALAGNTKQCEKAALEPKGLAKQVTVGPGICKLAGSIVESGHRLRGLQARAASRMHRASAKTARAPVAL
jgi:hypothetical protein